MQPQQTLARRGPPPKFRPFMIIVVVISLGLVFIGMTLTIIAHWPGYTSIGNNPLKIVGPVLLSVGGVAFVGCIVEVVRKSQTDKKNFTRQMKERERMMSFINRTQSQASLGRSGQYAPVPQQLPPPIQAGPPYYAGGVYPPSQQQNNNYADPNFPTNGGGGYPGDEDDVFVPGVTSSRAPSLARNGTFDDSMYDTVDEAASMGGGHQQQQGAPGVIVPEPMRHTAGKSRSKARDGPETDAERARRERQEKKRRLKELQSTSSEAQ